MPANNFSHFVSKRILCQQSVYQLTVEGRTGDVTPRILQQLIKAIGVLRYDVGVDVAIVGNSSCHVLPNTVEQTLAVLPCGIRHVVAGVWLYSRFILADPKNVHGDLQLFQ